MTTFDSKLLGTYTFDGTVDELNDSLLDFLNENHFKTAMNPHEVNISRETEGDWEIVNLANDKVLAIAAIEEKIEYRILIVPDEGSFDMVAADEAAKPLG